MTVEIFLTGAPNFELPPKENYLGNCIKIEFEGVDIDLQNRDRKLSFLTIKIFNRRETFLCNGMVFQRNHSYSRALEYASLLSRISNGI